MGLHSVKADGKQMESTADGALDPWSCFFIYEFSEKKFHHLVPKLKLVNFTNVLPGKIL